MSWDKWGNHILIELKRLNVNIEKLKDEINKEHRKIAKDITTLKVKAGFIGAVFGAIMGAVPSIFKWLSQ